MSGEFYFPLVGVEYDEEGCVREARFGGEVEFTAHGGMLRVVIGDPLLTVHGRAAVLSFVPSAGESTEEPIDVVDVVLEGAKADGPVQMWHEAATALTHAGAELFGWSYATGEPMAALTVRVPAGRPSGREDEQLQSS